MKKLLSKVITAALVLSSLAITAYAAPDKGSYGEVPMVKGDIVIDGKMDEIYNLGLKIDASEAYADSYASDTTAELYLLHDGAYLYVFYNVNSAFDIDPAKYNPDNANAADSWKSSGTELFIDWANDGTNAKMHGWIDGRMWGAGGTACEGNEDLYVADYKTTYDIAAKTYTMEWKLPMLEGAGVGSEVGFYVMITSNEDMTDGVQQTICTTTPGLANMPAEFLNITLSDTVVELAPEVVEEPAPAETTATESVTAVEAPKTFDAGVIAVIAAVVSAAGYSLTKKR